MKQGWISSITKTSLHYSACRTHVLRDAISCFFTMHTHHPVFWRELGSPKICELKNVTWSTLYPALPRTDSQARRIHREGMRFVQTHLLLTRESQRILGQKKRELNYRSSFLGFEWSNCFTADVVLRMGKLHFIVRPKLHVFCPIWWLENYFEPMHWWLV